MSAGLLYTRAAAAQDVVPSTPQPPTTQTPADDEVDLLDGASLRGHVIEQVPGSHVVIQTPDGRVQSVPWAQVKRVSTATLPKPPSSEQRTATAVVTPSSAPPSDASRHGPAPTESLDSAPPAPKPPPESGLNFEFGARAAYGFADGDYASNIPLGNASLQFAVPAIHGSVPITLDVGMRFEKHVYVGGFFGYALLSNDCFSPPNNSSVTCGGHDLRAGVTTQLHVMPRSAVDPWFGVGISREWLSTTASATSAGTTVTMDQTFSGWNFVDLMLGLDMRLSPGLGLGPYLEFTSGSFASVDATLKGSNMLSAQSNSSDIASTSAHQWFYVGVRGTYEVGARDNPEPPHQE